MDKKLAIELLGGTVTLAAKAIGINAQAISQWPDVLPARIADRVQAALWRKHVVASTEGQHAAEKAEA